MHLRILWVTLILTVLLAVGFVKLVRVLGLQDQLAVIIPLLPVFYALLYPALEKSFKEPSSYTAHLDYGRPKPRWSGQLNAILLGILASFVARSAYRVGLPPLLMSVRGHPVDIAGHWRLGVLAAEMSVISVAGGACVGLLARASAVLEGVVAGLVVAIYTGANEFAPLYDTLEEFSARFGSSFGLPSQWGHGLLIGLGIQVFLFAAWSGLAYRLRARLSPARSRL